MEAHNGAGHFGWDSTLARLKETYWWPGMYTDTFNHTRSCMHCQRFSKKIVHTKPMEPIVVDKIFELWGIVFVGPLPPSKSGKTSSWLLPSTSLVGLLLRLVTITQP
ncbi:hypothetical protein DSO57_1039647 [Entomophthora muscae]|uniref:Uncharacterized protein n=1 Tax=Entomophthora muscae TaxID=34485 RepID=A0ACC2S3N9_9FUNG|nr:hypothetical protein DSO57_1039647 [Entomophthora muscae]